MNALPRLSREQYDAVEAVNWSTLKHLGRSPAHYIHGLTPSTDDTDAKQRGRVLHYAVFEPERYRHQVAVWHEKRQGKAFDDFAKANAGKEIITSRMRDNVEACAKAVRFSSQAARYVASGRAEQAVLWRYDEPKVADLPSFSMQCKSMLDFISDEGVIADLKSTRDASPTGFAREVLRYEYHVQAAFYVDALKVATGRTLPFVFIAVEAAAPQVVQVYRVNDDDIQLGRERYMQLLAQLNVCREESRWHGYAETEMELTLPRWARPLEDDDGLDPDLVIGG